MASTTPLWFPASGDQFPVIPLLGILTDIPLWVDWCTSGLVLAGWYLASIGRKSVGTALAFAAGLSLICLNQHRLQPWFYEFTLLSMIMTLSSARRWRSLSRFLFASIYIYSALSKFDATFFETLGPQLVREAIRLAGFSDAFPGEPPSWIIAAGLLTEMGVSILLIFQRVAWIGAALGIALHAAILSVLGPWGLDHSWGVLLWNVHCIGMLVLLTRRMPCEQDDTLHEGSPTQWTLRECLIVGLLLPPMVMPITEHWSLWDHWPSWAVYAPHCSKAQVFVPLNRVEELPESLQRLIDTDNLDEGEFEVAVPLGSWSLQETWAPLYPQARFQVGAAIFLTRRLKSQYGLRCVVWYPANRFTGRRRRVDIHDRRSLERFANRYWVNAYPRLSNEQHK